MRYPKTAMANVIPKVQIKVIEEKEKPKQKRATRKKKAAVAAYVRARAISAQQNLGMNKTEGEYSRELEFMQSQGIIVKWRYEPIKLILVHGIPKLRNEMTYTPDFQVVTPEGYIEFHETKGGHIREDSTLKIKMAAELFPEYKFRRFQKLTKKQGGGWKEALF
jgi:hypothetical protein